MINKKDIYLIIKDNEQLLDFLKILKDNNEFYLDSDSLCMYDAEKPIIVSLLDSDFGTYWTQPIYVDHLSKILCRHVVDLEVLKHILENDQ